MLPLAYYRTFSILPPDFALMRLFWIQNIEICRETRISPNITNPIMIDTPLG
jgi:hypothetical protein